MKIEDEDWLDLSYGLEEHHAIFYKLWQVGKPVFTQSVDTAAVQFDKQGKFVLFLFNPHFWNSISRYDKLFVICHECLHLILNHGVRIKDIKSPNVQACNQCLDIVVNHLLTDGFGFKRERISNYSEYCWVDNVFPNLNLSKKETFEYYYGMFVKQYGDGCPSDSTNTVDDHKSMDFDSYDLLKEAASSLSNYELDSLSFIEKHTGNLDGKKWALLKSIPKVKKKWESVINEWSLTSKKSRMRDSDQWARLHRRLSTIASDLMLPSEMELESTTLERDRIRVFFFLDSSGSCWELKDRFFNAAMSLDPKFFLVELFCFDTGVQRVDVLERKVLGGGGTSFAALEKFLVDSGENYPDAVFVVTDGYGDRVYPKFPQRWHWFLTEDSYASLVPKESKRYKLADFE